MGTHLPLMAQLDFTAGGCADFARVARPVVGGDFCLLYGTDRRQLEEHDHPVDLPMCIHVFVRLPDGTCVDAEGARTLTQMLRGFGVRRGWSYRLVDDADGSALQEEFPFKEERSWIREEAADLIEAHGWADGLPAFDNALSRNWKAVTAQREAAVASGAWKPGGPGRAAGPSP